MPGLGGTWPPAVLAVTGVGLLAVTLATARRPATPVPDAHGYLRRWTALHGDYDPVTGSVFLRGWLLLAYRVARPLARRGVLPDILTLWSVWVACVVVAGAAAGGAWPLLAGWLLVLSGLGDTLDGCVAVLTDRATRWGYVLDSAVDRINDVLYLLAVVAVGAPPALAVVTGVAFGMLEYVRARGANAGAGEIGVVTVGERANRVILCAVALVFGGVFAEHRAVIATGALAALGLLSLTGLVQILVAVHRHLRAGGA